MSTTLEQKKGNKIRSLSNTITSQYGIATGNQNLTKDNDEKQAKIIEEQRKKQKRQRTTKGSTIFGKDINYRLDEDDKKKINYILDRLEKKFPNMNVEKRRKSAIVKMKNNEEKELTKEEKETLDFITEQENKLKEKKAVKAKKDARRQKMIQKVERFRIQAKKEREVAAEERFNMMEKI